MAAVLGCAVAGLTVDARRRRRRIAELEKEAHDLSELLLSAVRRMYVLEAVARHLQAEKGGR